MHYAILADIHGNLPALEAVLADLDGQPIDEILIAGDVVSGCPYPHETIEKVRSLGRLLPCRCIRGNNETYLLNMHRRTCHPDMLTSLQWGATRWAFAQLTPADLDWVASLPVQLSLDSPRGGIRVVHGTLKNENHATVPDRDQQVIAQLEKVKMVKPGQPIQPLAQILADIQESVLICGHIHLPWQQREGQKLALNPGAVGIPNNRDPRAQYALLTCEPGQRGQWRAELRQVDYDHARVKRAFQSSGLLEAGNGFARACMLDLDSAKNTVWDFVQHAFSYARMRGYTGAVIPDDLWLEAINTFDWENV